MKSPKITCTLKKIVRVYWVAVTPDEEELSIKGINTEDLVDGKQIDGFINQQEVQDRYTDGSYARSITTTKWLQVTENK